MGDFGTQSASLGASCDEVAWEALGLRVYLGETREAIGRMRASARSEFDGVKAGSQESGKAPAELRNLQVSIANRAHAIEGCIDDQVQAAIGARLPEAGPMNSPALDPAPPPGLAALPAPTHRAPADPIQPFIP